MKFLWNFSNFYGKDQHLVGRFSKFAKVLATKIVELKFLENCCRESDLFFAREASMNLRYSWQRRDICDILFQSDILEPIVFIPSGFEKKRKDQQKRKDKQAERPRKQNDKQARNLTRHPEEKRIIGTT